MLKNIIFSIFIFSAAFWAGCAPPEITVPRRICPGKDTAEQALATLKARAERAVSFRATGMNHLIYFDHRQRRREENFTIRLWVQPPENIYMQGDIAFDPRGLMLGSNEELFWFAIRPEASLYQWGYWDEQDQAAAQPINPKLVLEALGLVLAEAPLPFWELEKEGPFDVLTELDEQGDIVKKIFIEACEYRVFSIEYFHENAPAVIVEMSDYTEVESDFFVPQVIRLADLTDPEQGIEMTVNLRRITPDEFTAQQQRALFSRPATDRYENVFRIIQGIRFEDR